MEKLWKRKKRATKHREKLDLTIQLQKGGRRDFLKKRDKWREEKKGAEVQDQNKWLKP